MRGSPFQDLARTPPWVRPPFTVAADFANDRYFNCDLASLLTVSTSANGWVPNKAGIYTQQAAANLLRRQDTGAWSEEGRTNVVLQNRDLTQAAWTKSNITASLNQVGVDGASNSATSLTATAGNGTALQAITLGSSARFQSAFVKRITGSGTIDMTMDNGTTWTAITPGASTVSLGDASCRVTIPTQTLANPTVGFRIVTNGDAIAVDFVQNENGAYGPTTPIATAAAAVTRAADAWTIKPTGALGRILYSGQGTILFRHGPLLASGSNDLTFLGESGGTFSGYSYANVDLTTFKLSTTGTIFSGIPNPTSNSNRFALSWKAGTINGYALGSTVGPGSISATLDTTPNYSLGSGAGVSNWMNGPLQAIYASPRALSNGELEIAAGL